MSAMLHLKGVILSHMSEEPPKIRKAVLDLVNSIDSDLDEYGYVQSDETEDAIEALNLALCDIEESPESSSIDDEVETDPLEGLNANDGETE